MRGPGDRHGARLQPVQRLDQVGPSGPRGTDGRVTLHQGPQRDLLLPREPSELRTVLPELGAPPLHQRQHLQHAVVHRAREPGPLGHPAAIRSASARASVASRIRPLE